jgi:hypothetical protein
MLKPTGNNYLQSCAGFDQIHALLHSAASSEAAQGMCADKFCQKASVCSLLLHNASIPPTLLREARNLSSAALERSDSSRRSTAVPGIKLRHSQSLTAEAPSC